MTVMCFGQGAIFSISLRAADYLALHGKYLKKNTLPFITRKCKINITLFFNCIHNINPKARPSMEENKSHVASMFFAQRKNIYTSISGASSSNF